MTGVTVLHAYSGRNRGDGWLVELTHRLLLDAGVRAEDITTVALEPDTFGSGVGAFVGSAPRPPKWVSPATGLYRSASSVLVAGTSVRRLVAESSLVVGVGGGYLRAGTTKAATKTLLAHGPQLAVAAKGPCASIYLPQSIGPLQGPVGALLRRQLQHMTRVYVRDDTSLREVPFAKRAPDLAALEVGKLSPTLSAGTRVVLSVRSVGRNTTHKNLASLNAVLQPDVLGVQSRGGGNEDLPLTEAIARPGQRILPMAEAAVEASVVVAVRLHAAVAAIAAGKPTVHLSYERKGWGVFADLGLTEWVHDIHRFDADDVAAQVSELQRDPARYWTALQSGLANLEARRRELIEVIATAHSGRMLAGRS